VHWLIESQAEGFDQHLALERWLAADHEHQRAWAHIQQVNQRLRGVASPVVHATLQAPPSRPGAGRSRHCCWWVWPVPPGWACSSTTRCRG
jgi:ferric-dicitrate binding protein FerR (iron transport regulator)